MGMLDGMAAMAIQQATAAGTCRTTPTPRRAVGPGREMIPAEWARCEFRVSGGAVVHAGILGHGCSIGLRPGRGCRLGLRTSLPPEQGRSRFFLEDLKSTNGTFLNGVRLPPDGRVPLKPDDAVHLGSHALDVRGLLAKLGLGTGGGTRIPRSGTRPRSEPGLRPFDRSADGLIPARPALPVRGSDPDRGPQLGQRDVRQRETNRPADRGQPGDTIGLGSYTFNLDVSIPPPSPVTQATVPDQGQERAHPPTPASGRSLPCSRRRRWPLS